MLYRTKVAVLFWGTYNTQHSKWAECTIFRGVRKIAKSDYYLLTPWSRVLLEKL